MAQQKVRIGIVGAGANTRARHIPGFRAIDGVELVSVANRTSESTNRVSREFEIPTTYDNWQELITDDQIDAVMIGTWPDLHCEVTCAALEAGKHVLTEARMARNLEEARKMLAVSEQHPDLVAQIVPSPYGLTCGPFVESLIRDRFLGELRELVVLGADDVFWDYSSPFHWRQDQQVSGLNTLALGILHETALRWTPAPIRVFAQSTIFEPQRPNLQTGEYSDVTVPDSVQIVTQLEGGGAGPVPLQRNHAAWAGQADSSLWESRGRSASSLSQRSGSWWDIMAKPLCGRLRSRLTKPGSGASRRSSSRRSAKSRK